MPTLRIYEAHGSRIKGDLSGEFLIANIPEYTTLYAEIIPEEERNPGEEDQYISVFHFDKEPTKAHGVPFRFVVKPVSLGIMISPSIRKLNGCRVSPLEIPRSVCLNGPRSKESNLTRSSLRLCSDLYTPGPYTSMTVSRHSCPPLKNMT